MSRIWVARGVLLVMGRKGSCALVILYCENVLRRVLEWVVVVGRAEETGWYGELES